MSEVFDVAIIGLGVMGAAAAWQLSKTSVSVIGFDQFKVPHTLGSSHGKTRIIRQAYYEHPSYVPLLKRSYELWRELERESGQSLLHQIGALYFGPPHCELLVGTLESSRLHALAIEELSLAELEARFPQLVFPAGSRGVYEPSAGFLSAEESVVAFIRLARTHGANLLEECPVRGWSKSGSQFVVHTDQGDFKAKKIMISGGSYTPELLPNLPLKVTRQSVQWVQPVDPWRWSADALPVTAFETAGKFLYTIPSLNDGPIKIAAHAIGPEVDPRKMDRTWNHQDRESLKPAFEGPFANLHGDVVETSVCTYTNTPDGHFIIDFLDDPNIVITAGFSGHGFKFAPIVGELCRNLLFEKSLPQDIELFSLRRLKPLP